MSAAPVYVPVPVDSLSGEEKIEFDLYVQLSAKHVLYLRKGGVFDSTRLEKMREKNVRNMWILAEDESRFRLFAERRVEKAFDPASDIDPLRRATIIHDAQAAAAEAIMSDPRDVAAYTVGAEGARKFTAHLLRSDAALKSLMQIPRTSKTIASHGVAVAAIAVALAKKLGFGEAKDLHLLALGCLLHDIGHAKDGTSGFGQKISSLKPEQTRAHREHTMAGARLVQDLVHFDQHVIKIVLEHEEHVDGTGFPKGFSEKQMHAYSVIAATANAFEHMMSFEEETPQTAMKRFVIEKIGRHPLAHINALKSILQSLGT